VSRWQAQGRHVAACWRCAAAFTMQWCAIFDVAKAVKISHMSDVQPVCFIQAETRL
jgi:hypothetical protein